VERHRRTPQGKPKLTTDDQIRLRTARVPQRAENSFKKIIGCVGDLALAQDRRQSNRDIRGNGLIAFGVVATVGLCAILALVLWGERADEIQKATRAEANIVAAISSDIDRNLELYDLSIQAVIDGLKAPDVAKLSPQTRQLLLFDRSATAKDLGSIFVLDKDGKVIIDSRSLNPAPVSHAGRDYFTVQKFGVGGGLFLSCPWTAEDGEAFIAISRRLTDENGQFAGVVVGTLRLSLFQRLFQRVTLGPQDALALVRDDGSLVMRSPFLSQTIGRNVANTEVFRHVLSRIAGAYEHVSVIDDVDRLYVFQHIGEYPLTLSYGASVEAIYGAWRSKALTIGIITLILCGSIIALIAFLVRALRRRSEAEQQLAVMATTDSLTGLCNRRHLDEAFNGTWRQAITSATPVAVLMIDIDHFKQYNDQHGHQAGDEALRAVAQCIRGSLPRPIDLAARYGGEEFCVLLPEASKNLAADTAERIRASILALREEQRGRPDSTPTLSVGIASMVPRHGLQPRDLLRAADIALYDAKRQGRNCIVKSHGTEDMRVVNAA
jgi:diguanylate cyclase (GGDEF)-like protein